MVPLTFVKDTNHKLRKPDFVSKLSFIWDKHCCLPLAAYPGSSERAALKRAYTWHYSTQGLPMPCITAKHRERLPHVFTLAFYMLPYIRRLFSVALSIVYFHPLRLNKHPVVRRWVALCCPDFPFQIKFGTIARVCSNGKYRMKKPAISYQLSAISYQLSAFSFQLSAFSFQLSAFSFQLSAKKGNISYEMFTRILTAKG